MAKPNIKWRPLDEKKLATYVRKFNASVTRLEKQYPEAADSGALPERLVVSELKQRIKTRADFNREMRSIDRLFKKGARDLVKDSTGFYTTRWQKKEEQYLQQRVNRLRKSVVQNVGIPKSEVKGLGLAPVDIEAEKAVLSRKLEKAESEEAVSNLMQQWKNFVYKLQFESSDKYYAGQFMKTYNGYLKAMREHLLPEDYAILKNYLESNEIKGSEIMYAITLDDAMGFDIYYTTDDAHDKFLQAYDVWQQLMPKILKERERNASRNS